MDTFTVQTECGFDSGDHSNCDACNGSKIYVYYNIKPPTNVFYSYIILETFDATEYNELTEGQVGSIKMLLSCGLVDLNDGKAGKVTLWTFFGAESTTVASLTALLA